MLSNAKKAEQSYTHFALSIIRLLLRRAAPPHSNAVSAPQPNTQNNKETMLSLSGAAAAIKLGYWPRPCCYYSGVKKYVFHTHIYVYTIVYKGKVSYICAFN